MLFTPSSIVALIVASSFAAGLNVYATVATLGLLARCQWVTLPVGLDSLSDPWIIAISLLLFIVEAFADKIPALDLFWNAAHTFVRIPVAALLAYKTASQLSPELQLVAAALGAGIAALAHTSKTAARALVTTSPEPLTNIALSSSEDFVAISLTWLATHHPYAAGFIATVGIVLLLLSLKWILLRVRCLKRRLFSQQSNM
jgi:ABC-type Co2+ transport system permease subunit